MKTSISVPPPSENTFYWERGSDPFHPLAFKGIEGISFPSKDASKPRAEGWMAIDYAENEIGFVPDGTEFDTEPDRYMLGNSSYDRLCAVPEKCYDEFATRHKMYRENKAKRECNRT